ncbi:MAG: choice-of-anchor J domain-containing protein [Candidatus Cloacimonetes bacterium]|nr:choice-of-anchor J domain-containing protein [Candidatus Cloacimonadota bacterium]
MRNIILTLALWLSFSFAFAQWHIDEDFEGITTLPAGWTIFDDGDGMVWRNISHAYAHSGSRAAFVDNYLPNQNADWLISPQIPVSPGDSLLFFTRAWVSTENLKVYVSTGAPTPSDFTQLLANITDIGTQYQQIRLSLQAWAGQNIYLGFFWQCSNYGILVDDVKIGQVLSIDAQLNLPESISFFERESYTLDLSPYIVCSSLEHASIAVAENPDLDVELSGLSASISSDSFIGSTSLLFTLTDLVTGQTASDTLSVIVMPNPAIDLAFEEVISPRPYEYLDMPFFPAVRVINLGTQAFEEQIQISLNVYDESEQLIHTDNAVQNTLLAPLQSDTITFLWDFTPTQIASLSFVFDIDTPDGNLANNQLIYPCNIVNRHTTGGPDAFGYRYIDSNNPLGPAFEWLDISQTGTSSITYGVNNNWAGDDNFSEPIPLGFSFPFYGTNYSSAWVDINGEILFAPNNWYVPYPGYGWDNDGNMFNYVYPIPGFDAMPGLIAVFWDDLYAEQGTGDVYFQSFGEAPNRYAIIQWDNLRFYAGTGGTPDLKFQVILMEDGNIKMQYLTVATGQTGANVPHDNGLSVTVALQNAAANAGIVYVREIVQNNQYLGIEPEGNFLHPDLAILFYSGEDQQAPIITHSPVGNTFQQNIELSARILDMSALESTTLHYNLGSGWQQLSPDYIQNNDYYFNLSELTSGANLQYYFEAVDSHGNSARLPQNAPAEYFDFCILPRAQAKVLVAYSGKQDYQRTELPIYEGILTEMNIPYDIYNWEEYSDYSIPAQYEGVLAYASTGTVSDKMYYFAQVLANYLDLGTPEAPRNLWFASDGLASSQHAHPNSSSIRRLLAGYLRTEYIASGFGGGSNGLGGPENLNYEHGSILALAGTEVGNAGQEYPVYANSPDCIFPLNSAPDHYSDAVPYPEIGAIYSYAFEDGPFNGHAYLYHGVAATQLNTPSYRSMYFSFDFSQLTNPSHRLQWMQDIMRWWNITPMAAADIHTPALANGISSIYPNPFNPHTTIQYQLAAASKVKLKIYNLKGQMVKTLVQETKSAGSHSAVFDGRDNAGLPLPSGVYLVQLSLPNQRFTQKISILK